jgi:3-deoxy-D-manno-octulosonic-acid transferase
VFLLLDIIYLLAIPFLVIGASISRFRGHPRRRDLRGRLGYGRSLPSHTKRILIHAVSVGEVNALRTLIPILGDQGYDVVICVTTDTGLARANNLFGDTYEITRFPLDFSFSIRRFLTRIRPTVVGLVELEVWPNLIGICSGRDIPVLVINGRLSERSFKRYSLAKPFLRRTFTRLTAIGMQNESYAARVRDLGGINVHVHGTMKWDNAVIKDSVKGADALAKDLGIDPEKPLIVAGSTTPEEHTLFMNATPEGSQLLCAPRRPEWFDDAAKTLAPCTRRTEPNTETTMHFLLDTIGELDMAYAIADIVVIGRSFSPHHGSDPTQSVALGKPTIIGPNVSDFTEMVATLVDGGGMIQCTSDELQSTLAGLLEKPSASKQLAIAGRKIIESQQGATQRYVDLIMESTPS